MHREGGGGAPGRRGRRGPAHACSSARRADRPCTATRRRVHLPTQLEGQACGVSHLSKCLLHSQHLIHDLVGKQVARKASFASGAERAAHGAADLRGRQAGSREARGEMRRAGGGNTSWLGARGHLQRSGSRALAGKGRPGICSAGGSRAQAAGRPEGGPAAAAQQPSSPAAQQPQQLHTAQLQPDRPQAPGPSLPAS